MSIQTNKLPDNPNIDVIKAGKTGLFTNYIYKAIPLAFDESMSYYETLLGLLHYLKNVIIPTVNNNADAVAELQTLYEELRTYVDDYFTNLDVQEEINNKLDKMVEDGTLDQIIEQYLNSSAIWGFDSVADMKNATNLINGSYAHTLGYYTANDGGGATYKITDTSSETDYQEELNNGLYANLIVTGDCISFKQLGAKGDGLTDNSSIITKGLDFVKNKNVSNLYINEGTFILNNTQIIIPNGLHLFGCGNKSIIKVNEFSSSITDKVFITNNFDDVDIDTFIIEKFKIVNNSTNGIRSMRFRKTNGVIIRDMQFVNEADARFSAVDLYSENTNALIEKCYILSTSIITDQISGAFSVREYNPEGITENITIKSCYCEKTGVDESLWIDSWFGKVKNVLVEDFIIKDLSATQSADCIAIVCNRNNSRCENITLKNCYFYKIALHNRMMNIAHSQLEEQIGHTDNILIENCIFETDEIITGGHTHFIDIGEFLENRGATVKNCQFINKDLNNPISYFIYSNVENPIFYSENNKFYGLSDVGIRHILSSKNDYFEKAPITATFKYCQNIDNFKCDETIPFLNTIQQEHYCNKILISNLQDLKCNDLLTFSANTVDIDVKILNSEIKNERNIIRSNNQGEHTISLELLDCDIKTPTISNVSTINVKSSNLSVLGEIFKGIPTNSHDRNNYPIGTVFFSNTPTKSIVRKISEGNASLNWEEI